MSAQIDCPICMDVIEVSRNCVTTECGHCFHASCLMQSVAHNGFGCPYCRTAMAEVPAEEDSDDGYSYEDDVTVFDEDALTSFRMFHQRLNDEEVEEEPEDWETDDEDDEEEDEDELPAEPDAAYVAQKLVERGITFEDLVKNILIGDHSNFGALYRDYERRSSEVYGQFRAVIAQYRPEPQIAAPTPAPEQPIASRSVEVDYEAQPKLTKVSFIRQVSCC
jgi:hypothetical protein